MSRRRHRPASAVGTRRDGDLHHGERTPRARATERPRKDWNAPEGVHGADPFDVAAEGAAHAPRSARCHDAELESGIGETDGLAEVDGVVFVGPRLGEVAPLAPEVNPHRELAVVGGLMHREVPSVELEWMPGEWVDLKLLAQRSVVVYCHPGTDAASVVLDEEEMLGADAAESRGFAERDLDFAAARHGVLGISSQTSARQHALATEEMLPHVVLSDGQLDLAEEMGLPTFDVDGMRLYERLTFIAREGRVRKVFYPVPDPATHAAEVAEWLREDDC